MNRTMTGQLLISITLSLGLISCGGMTTFHDYARPGDTVAVAAGWKRNFNKDNITVTITPSVGVPVIIPPGDPAIRASVNLYPDPLSSIIISREIGTNLTFLAQAYSAMVNDTTNQDKDWYQSTVFLNLPASLPVGPALIEITNSQGNTASSTVEIIDGAGSPATFTADVLQGPLSPAMLKALSRTSNYIVSFDAPTIPYAIEITLSHTTGTGTAFAVNPLGYKKNLAWSDNGTTLKAILTPASDMIIDHMNDYKFYVAGGVTNLAVVSLQAYDINGNVVPGVTSSLSNND